MTLPSTRARADPRDRAACIGGTRTGDGIGGSGWAFDPSQCRVT